MSTPRKIAIAILLTLGLLLAVAFFLVYFMENESDALELTAPDSGGASESGAPAIPAEEPVSPENAPEEGAAELRVYVAGAVKNPGVYPLAAGNRLVDAVEAAGGATDNADLEAVNLAMQLEDEGYYYIPAKPALPVSGLGEISLDEVSPTPTFPRASTNRPTAESPAETEEPGSSDGEPDDLVNLNTATQAELETLPNIGPARARAIIVYREENGPFAAVEEITAVSGIGPVILNNLQGLITVGDSP